MTARQVYEGVLVELNKVGAPTVLMEDFNYLFNKAIYQYINKRYNIYDVDQQTSDDLRVLKATTILSPKKAYGTTYPAGKGNADLSALNKQISSLYGATYEVELPKDYLHILNCLCNFRVAKTFKCYDAESYVQFAATRLTSDMFSQIINNFYLRPSYKRPYYFINNVNMSNTVPTYPYVKDTDKGTDMNGTYKVTTETGASGDNSNLPRTMSLKPSTGGETTVSLVEKPAAVRYGNASTVNMEIRYGKDDSVFVLESVYIDYIKTPQYIRLTQEQIDLTEDTSQMMEFPDYVCQQIIDELTHILMENASDPRLQTHIPISQSIANPAQAAEQPKK